MELRTEAFCRHQSMEARIGLLGYMETHKISISLRTLIISTCILIATLVIEHLALGGYSGGRPRSESRVVEKISAHISEENFWAHVSQNKSELKLILLTSEEKPNSADMDALAVIPEINETLKIKMCQTEPAIILSGSANSDLGKVDG